MAKSKKVFVSVIIPTFNRADWIKYAIDSVLNQTYSNFELIIVDDGSTDNTRDVLAQYGDSIRYFFQENKGPAAARNLGIINARGSYICFLDSDDRWLKQKLEEQIKLVVFNPEIKVCYTNEIWIRRGVRVNPRKIHQKFSGWIYQRCLPLCIISPSSVMVHQHVFEKVGLFDEKLPACEDYDLWLRISCRYPVFLIDTPLIMKRGGHADQLSKTSGLDKFRIQALKKILESNLLSKEQYLTVVQALEKKCAVYSGGCIKRGRNEEASFYANLAGYYSAS